MTLCKYSVFILSDMQTHWLQCVLPLNVYLRKIIIVIYIWLIVLIFLVVNDIIRFILYLIEGKSLFIRLIQNEKIDEYEIKRNLNPDTLVIMKLLRSNVNSFYASAIATNIYNNKTKIS